MYGATVCNLRITVITGLRRHLPCMLTRAEKHPVAQQMKTSHDEDPEYYQRIATGVENCGAKIIIRIIF